MDEQETLLVNIRGRKFEVMRSVLNRFPQSKLALLNNESSSFRQNIKEHYFDTNAVLFDNILDAYSNGEAHLPQSICLHQIQTQLEFWTLDESIFAPCCWNR